MTAPVVPAAEVGRAAAALVAGELVVVPTDTVYGLAADARAPGAVNRLFTVKGRPAGVPVAVLVADADQARSLVAGVPAAAESLMERFWPGALTLVLPRRPGLAPGVGDERGTIGVRLPDHPTPRRLAAQVGPLATSSANRHGRPTPPTAGEVAAELGDEVALVLDGGPAAGTASTVVDCTSPALRVLREGAIPAVAVLGAAG